LGERWLVESVQGLDEPARGEAALRVVILDTVAAIDHATVPVLIRFLTETVGTGKAQGGLVWQTFTT
jgi:hypothetical protein